MKAENLMLGIRPSAMDAYAPTFSSLLIGIFYGSKSPV